MSQKTMKKVAIVISGLMVLSVLLGLIAPLAYATNQEVLDQLVQAEAQLEALENERANIEARLAEIEKSQQATYEEIAILDEQISNTTAQIEVTQQAIDALAEDISIEEKNLAVATQKMETQYADMKTSIRVMYEAGETTYLDILLASDSFFDMLSRIEITQQIMNHNQSVFEEYAANAQAVEDAKIKLEADKEAQVDFRITLDSQVITLEKESALVEEKMKELMADEQAALEAQDANLASEEEMADRVAQLSKELATQGVYVGGDLMWPTPSSTRITSPFGYRVHPISGSYTLHKGVDIGAGGGQDILAANSGTVIVSDYHSSYGNYVMIDHGGGMVTLYAHMSKRSVSAGQTVGKGELVGLVGSTGYSTGNHLHFEVIVDGTHTDPMSYFS